jgi:hypothetical protein
MNAPHVPQSAWMRMPSGRRIDLANPDPDAWTDHDLASRLSRVYRWGGESMHSLPMSVAQHSLAVLELRRQNASEPLSINEQLLLLLHDADEAILGWDPISSLKPLLGDPLRSLCERIGVAIALRYQLGPWEEGAWKAYKSADVACAASEALCCVGWTRDEISNVLGITAPILEKDPLAKVYGCTPWEPWPSTVAFERFYHELLRLLAHRERFSKVETA